MGNDHVEGIARLFFEDGKEKEVFPLSEATYYEKDMPGSIPCDQECQSHPQAAALKEYFAHKYWR